MRIQGHRIESTAWYTQIIVYHIIFPNKKMKTQLKHDRIVLLPCAFSRS